MSKAYNNAPTGLSEEDFNNLKEDINFWTTKVSIQLTVTNCFSIYKSSDLCLDLETMKGESEMDQDNITEEFERMNKELASVQASIQRL